MSRNNTGNPIDSKAFPDFEDNVKNLDQAVNAEQDTFQDRLGKSRLTWAGIVKAGSGDPAIAVDAAARAESAASSAESAASSAEQNAEQIAQDAAQQAVSNVVIAVDGAVDRAVNAADRAEDAYDAIYNSGALQSASIYETVADGLSGVADDEYFWVYPNSLNSIENLTLFKRVDAMTEELIYVQYDLNAFMIEEGANWETGEL